MIRPSDGIAVSVLLAVGPSAPLGMMHRLDVAAVRTLCELGGQAYDACRAHTRQVAVAAAALEVSGHGGSPHATACRALSLACALAEAAQGGVWVQYECGWYQIPYREAVAAAVPPAWIAGRTATERNLGTGDGALWPGGTAADPSLDARGKARRTVAAETNPMLGGVGCSDGLFGPGEQWIEPSPVIVHARAPPSGPDGPFGPGEPDGR